MELKDLLNPDALTLFFYFIVPGIVTIQVYDIMVPAERRNFGESLVQVVSYGLITNILFYRLYQWTLDSSSTGKFHHDHAWVYPVMYVLSFIVVVLIAPTLLAILVYKVRTERGLLNWLFRRFGITQLPVTQMPTVWDVFFSRRPTVFLIFHMKNGDKLAGAFGDHSYASVYPAEQMLYVEELLTVDAQTGKLERALDVARTGAIIRFEDCDYIETLPARKAETP